MVNLRAKKFVFLGVKRNMKGYRLWDPENKKIVLSRHVTFDETSILKSIVSQQVERTKTKEVWQRVKSYLYWHFGSVGEKHLEGG